VSGWLLKSYLLQSYGAHNQSASLNEGETKTELRMIYAISPLGKGGMITEGWNPEHWGSWTLRLYCTVRHFRIAFWHKPVGLWSASQSACECASSCLEGCCPCSDRWCNGRPWHRYGSPCVSEQQWLSDSRHHSTGTSTHQTRWHPSTGGLLIDLLAPMPVCQNNRTVC